MCAMPRVSVVIPSYNHEKYVAEAVQSVLDQTYQDFEIVITDDSSTDNTVKEIEKFRDPRIRLFVHERNGGQFVAMRKCIEEARGEYIAVLNSDDTFLPDKLQKQVLFLDQHPDIAAVFSYASIIDDDGNDFTDTTHPYYSVFKQPNRTRHEWLNFFFYKGNCLCHPSVLMRSNCHEGIGYYNERYAVFADFDFWIRLCLTDDIHIIPETLTKFRIRRDDANTSAKRPDVIVRTSWELTQILENYLNIKNNRDFLLIFPEAKKFGDSLEDDLIPYYLARIAIDIKYASYQFFAVNTLYKLLGDEKIALQLREKCGFESIDFIKLTGEMDAFNFREIFDRDKLLKVQDEQLALKEREMRLKNEEITRLRAIEDSASWRLIKRMLDFFDNRFLPPRTRRARIFRPLISRLAPSIFSRQKDALLFSEEKRKPSAIHTVEHYGIKGNRETTRIHKISFLITPVDGPSKRYRVYNLIEGLTQKGIECFVFQETDVDRLDVFLDSDLLVIFRVAYSNTVDFIIRKMRERNIPVVFDIDDLIFDHECLGFFDGLEYMSLVEQQQFRDGISRWRDTLLNSDYATCATDTIGRYVRKTGKDAFIIKNTINHEQFNLSDTLIRDKRYDSGESVKIGYFSGTHTHNKDFMEVSDALYEILKDYPSIEFHLVGHLDLEKKFFGFGQRVVKRPLMPYPDYLEYQSLMDINLAPLQLNNPFTDAKSELKIFEAALVGVPTVASPTASYKNCITDGIDGFLAGTKEEWYEKLSMLVENSSLRKRIAEIARKSFLERYYNKYVIDDAIRIYEGILDHYRAAYPKPSRTFIFPEKLPVFSVVSILYRKEDQIEYFLQSFLRQTYPGSFELIFVDDRSPDNSVMAVQDFIAKIKEEKPSGAIPDIRIIRNEKNLGNCASRNIGIQHTRGDAVIVIDADCVVNRDFLSAHAEAYAYGDCDVAIGPFNLETNGRAPFAVLEAYENNSAGVMKDAQLQDAVNETSFLNCITRNFSIRKGYIRDDLFDGSFSYSEEGKSGFGWEDIEMGYRLYKRGARIKFAAEAFSVHVSHPSSVDERTKPLRSLKNFRKLYEKHPELLLVGRRWTLDTYQKICEWAAHHHHGKNEDRLYLDNLFQRFLPSPYSIKKGERKLKILTYRWHCSHQYELYKLPYEFTLATGLGTCIADYWEYDKRPLPTNAYLKYIREIRVKDYDLAILHFDENVLSPENTNGVIAPGWGWGEALRWFRKNVKLPMVAICHGTPQFYGQYNIHYKEPNLMQVMEKERGKIVDFMGDVLVIVNSYQAQREWDFRKSKVIWHGFDPTEFYPARYERGILTMLEKAMVNRPHYNGYFVYMEVFRDFPEEYRPTTLAVAEPGGLYERNTNVYAFAKFRNYVDEVRRYSVYFNPTLRSPMSRSRGEAMMCGLVTVSVNNHDVELFIKNGVNGFYSNDPYELREYLLYLMKNPSKCKKMGMEGRKTAMDIFNHDRYLRAWEETISELLR